MSTPKFVMKLPSFFRPVLACALAGVALSTGCQNRLARPTRAPAIPANFAPAATAEPIVVDPALLQPPRFPYRLGPGDVLDIEVLGDVNTQATTIVGPDGKIYFYILPGIDVWGLTLNDARDRIVQELRAFIREQQPVGLTLRKSGSQRIWILGQLHQPGIYAMAGPMTLLDALALAGGPAPVPTFNSGSGALGTFSARGGVDDPADLNRAFILRDGHLLRVDFHRLIHEGDLSQNIYLRPNDFVYLPSAKVGHVHVLGAVKSPRAVDYVSQLTVAQAIAQTGGTLAREAHLSQVAIVRGSLTQPQIATIDLAAILAGKAPDIALQPQDIVYVPNAPYHLLTRYVDLILDTFVRAVGVNEGAKAADGRGQLGLAVPIGPR